MHICYLSFCGSGVHVWLSCLGSCKAAISLQGLTGEKFASMLTYTVAPQLFAAC